MTLAGRHQAALDMRQMLLAASGSRLTTVVSGKLRRMVSLWSGLLHGNSVSHQARPECSGYQGAQARPWRRINGRIAD